jgi:hypothetical protein
MSALDSDGDASAEASPVRSFVEQNVETPLVPL